MVIYRNLKLLKDEIESIIEKLGHPEYLSNIIKREIAPVY